MQLSVKKWVQEKALLSVCGGGLEIWFAKLILGWRID